MFADPLALRLERQLLQGGGWGQIGASPADGRRSSRGLGSKAPRIVMTCRVGSARRSAWASTSATASFSVSATATHRQEHDTAHGAATATT